MGWLANNLRGGQGDMPPSHPSEEGWGALLVPPELVEDHPRSRDRAFLLVRYTVVAAVFTLLFSPYFFLYLKLPYTLLLNVLYAGSLGITLLLLIAERSLGVGIFDPALGGDPVLYQHMFWFYSHPAVYIMVLPAMGVVSEILLVPH